LIYISYSSKLILKFLIVVFFEFLYFILLQEIVKLKIL
jgi:hypothetical protein